MNHRIDEQLELISQLLNNEQSEYTGSHSQKHAEGEAELDEVLQQRAQFPTAGNTSPMTRPDPDREQRKGVPEIVFGETKEVAQIIAMAQGLLSGSGRAIITRLRPETVAQVREAFAGYTVYVREASRSMVIYRPDYERQSSGGHVGVISAGTSDIPAADEAALIAQEMGCRVTCIYDVGVAGLHRLVQPLRQLLAAEVDAIIVAAGMDGALPSVVAGLVPVPVIGLPTSIGYGMGGKGIAALLSMLQTCAPGLSVVNIDNGVGAGSTAALIANRVAHARKRREQQLQ